MINGNKLTTSILRIDSNDYEPLETILNILPVYLFKWNAKFCR